MFNEREYWKSAVSRGRVHSSPNKNVFVRTEERAAPLYLSYFIRSCESASAIALAGAESSIRARWRAYSMSPQVTLADVRHLRLHSSGGLTTKILVARRQRESTHYCKLYDFFKANHPNESWKDLALRHFVHGPFSLRFTCSVK